MRAASGRIRTMPSPSIAITPALANPRESGRRGAGMLSNSRRNASGTVSEDCASTAAGWYIARPQMRMRRDTTGITPSDGPYERQPRPFEDAGESHPSRRFCQTLGVGRISGRVCSFVLRVLTLLPAPVRLGDRLSLLVRPGVRLQDLLASGPGTDLPL